MVGYFSIKMQFFPERFVKIGEKKRFVRENPVFREKIGRKTGGGTGKSMEEILSGALFFLDKNNLPSIFDRYTLHNSIFFHILADF